MTLEDPHGQCRRAPIKKDIAPSEGIQFPPIFHPSLSPELALSDFYQFGAIKGKMADWQF
jgi:hypothetical protein